MPLTISKNQNEVPDWMLKVKFPNADKKEAATASPISDEKDMVAAKTQMEKCAKDGKPFYFQKEITPQQKKELEEYAQVCKMDKKNLVAVSKEEKAIASQQKPESKEKPAPENKLLDGFAKPEAFKKNKDWEKVEAAQKLGKSDSTKTIVRGDGAETSTEQRIVGVKPGENSIAAPDNIENTAKSEEKTSQQKIVDANKKRKEDIAFDAKKWDKEHADKMKTGVLAKPGVQLTEAAQSQSRSKVADGQHSMFDKKDHSVDLPEKTSGEKLKEAGEKRKQDIQRPKTEDRSWDQESSSRKPTVSDLLYDELKKRMPKSSGGEKK